MSVFENKVTKESKEFLDCYLSNYEYKTSGLSFSSLFMWKDINQFTYDKVGDFVCINGVDNLEDREGENFMFPPLTKEADYDLNSLRETIMLAKKHYEERGVPFVMKLVPLHIVLLIKKIFCPNFATDSDCPKLKIVADRENFDYVYLRSELEALSGKKFHAKKNHLNYFKNHYSYEYVNLKKNMKDEVMVFLEKFNQKKTELSEHEKKLLSMELDAMSDVLDVIEEGEYISGVIKIDGKIEAISIGGILDKKTITVHVEKANTEYRGLYQLINNEYVKSLPCNYKYINREEDMGILGLRKAKLSYNPVKLVEKYTIGFL